MTQSEQLRPAPCDSTLPQTPAKVHMNVISAVNFAITIFAQKRTHLVCKHRHNEFPRLENGENVRKDLLVRGHRNVALKADVGKLSFRRDVHGHIGALQGKKKIL